MVKGIFVNICLKKSQLKSLKREASFGLILQETEGGEAQRSSGFQVRIAEARRCAGAREWTTRLSLACTCFSGPLAHLRLYQPVGIRLLVSLPAGEADPPGARVCAQEGGGSGCVTPPPPGCLGAVAPQAAAPT